MYAKWFAFIKIGMAWARSPTSVEMEESHLLTKMNKMPLGWFAPPSTISLLICSHPFVWNIDKLFLLQALMIWEPQQRVLILVCEYAFILTFSDSPDRLMAWPKSEDGWGLQCLATLDPICTVFVKETDDWCSRITQKAFIISTDTICSWQVCNGDSFFFTCVSWRLRIWLNSIVHTNTNIYLWGTTYTGPL